LPSLIWPAAATRICHFRTACASGRGIASRRMILPCGSAANVSTCVYRGTPRAVSQSMRVKTAPKEPPSSDRSVPRRTTRDDIQRLDKLGAIRITNPRCFSPSSVTAVFSDRHKYRSLFEPTLTNEAQFVLRAAPQEHTAGLNRYLRKERLGRQVDARQEF